MSASPEFYKPSAPAFSPLPPSPSATGLGGGDEKYSYYSCRTPTGSGISYLSEPTTCPPAPRKPAAPCCRKRLFQGEAEAGAGAGAGPGPTLLSLRLDELQRLFRPHPKSTLRCDKRRRRPASKQQPQLHRLEA